MEGLSIDQVHLELFYVLMSERIDKCTNHCHHYTFLERTVNGRTSTSQKLRNMVAVTLTASGEIRKPIDVYKGKPGALIKTREFPTFPDNNFYACQGSTWMDERIMQIWVPFGPVTIC